MHEPGSTNTHVCERDSRALWLQALHECDEHTHTFSYTHTHTHGHTHRYSWGVFFGKIRADAAKQKNRRK